MLRSRGFWAVLAVLVGMLQAWDSGLFGISYTLQAVGVCAIAGVGAAIALPIGQGARLGVLIAAAVALTLVRMASPVSLNTLHLALFMPAIFILFVDRAHWRSGHRRSEA